MATALPRPLRLLAPNTYALAALLSALLLAWSASVLAQPTNATNATDATEVPGTTNITSVPSYTPPAAPPCLAGKDPAKIVFDQVCLVEGGGAHSLCGCVGGWGVDYLLPDGGVLRAGLPLPACLLPASLPAW